MKGAASEPASFPGPIAARRTHPSSGIERDAMQSTQALYSNHLLPMAICSDRVARVQYAVCGLAGIEQRPYKITMDLLSPCGHCGRRISGVFRSLQALSQVRRARGKTRL